uniref:Metalloprotease RpA n=1 Tax=Ralstonia pickettii TaxID=329 RepID=A0A0E3X1L1_RALPI|nr:metalloprotease RpA [Ralstonia pickettii]
MSKVKEQTIASSVKVSNAYPTLVLFSHEYDRGGNLTVNGYPSYSVDQAASQLLREGASFQDFDGSGKIDLTFSFLTSASSSALNKHGIGVREPFQFSQFSTQQKAKASLAMQSWADVANVTFTEKATGGDAHLTFGNYSGAQDGAGAFAYLPGSPAGDRGSSWYLPNASYTPNKTPDLNNYGRQTLTHEIGHTLGLVHPGEYNAGNGNPTYNDASYGQDTRRWSVMSYWTESNTNKNYSQGGVDHYSAAPFLDDIAAIQKPYGANYSTRARETTYGFNSSTGRDFYAATSNSDKLVFSVWDGGGNDTQDFSGYPKNQRINLNESAFSDVGGLAGGVRIAKGVTIENAIGGSGNDLLIGNSAANELKGGAGNDIIYGGGGADQLYGGAGNDTFVYGACSDSKPGASDQILDFTSGLDKVDLTGITNGRVLDYVSAFSGHAGEALLSWAAGTSLGSLALDYAGHGVADFLLTTIGQASLNDIVA